MIIVTLFAVACSWFAVKMQQVKIQKEAVEAIMKLGGDVAYDYQLDDSSGINSMAVMEPPPGPAWLRKILGDDFFRTVAYVEPTNDASMLILKEMREIQQLNLTCSQVTDTGLKHLEGLTQLKVLYLGGPQVTDAGLEYLKGLIQLQRLDLSSNVTDAGLEHH